MDSFKYLSSLSCEIKIIRAKNVNFKSTGHLFVRCYLPAGNKKRIRLISKEISPNSKLVWNETTSLDCFGSFDSMDNIIQGNVVFELRCKNTRPIFGRINGSQLLGRAEIPWRSVIESPDMEFEKWVVMLSKSRRVHDEDVKPPMVQISMKIRAPVEPNAAERRRRRRSDNWNECGGCGDGVCKSCVDFDIFATGAALEGF